MPTKKTEPEKTQALSLTETFNRFAAKAVEDYPAIENNFILYNLSDGILHGRFFGATGPQVEEWLQYLQERADIAKDAHATAEKNGPFNIISYISPERQTDIDLMRTLQHELGHLVAPAGYSDNTKYNRYLDECVADTFSVIRLLQLSQEADNSIEYLIYRRASRMIAQCMSHPSVPVLIELKRLSQEHDLLHLTPIQTANLAYRLSLQYAFSESQLNELENIFLHTRQEGVTCRKLAKITLADHSEMSGAVFVIAKACLDPYLNLESKLKGEFWDDIRAKIKTREDEIRETPGQTRLRQLDYLQALGHFDKNPDQMIDPVQYQSPENQEYIRRTREAYATKIALKPAAPPSPPSR